MSETVLTELAGLKAMSMDQLKARWSQLSDKPPPAFGRYYLERRIAYRIQELTHGGLAPETRAQLIALGEAAARKPRRLSADRPVEGTRLQRQWRGATYEVIVTRDGFSFEGRPYRSLSAIAQAITGTKWNGLVFFGIKRGKA